jgi:Fur family ferric uptake transcriptional regulator
MTHTRNPGSNHKHEFKLTKGCRSVLEALEQAGDLTTAQDIHSMLRQTATESPGLTTVYRSLDSLVEIGLVQAVDLGDGEKRYEVVAPGEHHHHLICQTCNQSIHLDQCLVEDLEKTIKGKYGFVISSHVLEIFGYCRKCSPDGSKK